MNHRQDQAALVLLLRRAGVLDACCNRTEQGFLLVPHAFEKGYGGDHTFSYDMTPAKLALMRKVLAEFEAEELAQARDGPASGSVVSA